MKEVEKTCLRVAIYARVSTKRQEANDLSIPDQVAQGERWIEEHEHSLVHTFSEAGSATDDVRKQFQAMITWAEGDDHPVDIILCHSLSRMFRNALHFMQYRERLRRHRVRLISLTQSFGDDPAADLALGMLALFDEYHSAENAKHVKRTMLANAANGYWNGQTPPLGFRAISIKMKRGKDRKQLEHDPEAADQVRLIFKTYLEGNEEGPIGLTRLAEWLNERGERLKGNRFSVSNIHHILTNTAYIGYVMYNQRDSRTGLPRPEAEWMPIPVPPIVTETDYYAVRAQMAERDPRMGTAAEKTNTNLLTRLGVCGCDGDGCGGGLGTSTGKSGAYRYYTCANRVKTGAGRCAGRWVPMDKLDRIVVDALTDHLLQPDRLHLLLQTWLDRSGEAIAVRREELKRIRTRLTQLDGESANLLMLVRRNVLMPDDPQLASELGNIQALKNSLGADAKLIEQQIEAGDRRITPTLVEDFGALLRYKLGGPDDKLRRAYVRMLVDKVEVGDRQIRISGSKTALARAAMSDGNPSVRVPKAEREWCTRRDSNPWPLPSEGSALSS